MNKTALIFGLVSLLAIVGIIYFFYQAPKLEGFSSLRSPYSGDTKVKKYACRDGQGGYVIQLEPCGAPGRQKKYACRNNSGGYTIQLEPCGSPTHTS